jgi:hypothetical protein
MFRYGGIPSDDEAAECEDMNLKSANKFRVCFHVDLTHVLIVACSPSLGFKTYTRALYAPSPDRGAKGVQQGVLGSKILISQMAQLTVLPRKSSQLQLTQLALLVLGNALAIAR